MSNGHVQEEAVQEEDEDEDEEEEVEDGEDDVYLGLGRRDSNRDSDMSTATVTGATIVRKASLATRARANVINRTATIKREVDRTVRNDVEEEEDEDEDGDEDEDEDEDEELIFPPTPSPLQAAFAVGDTTPRNPSRHYKSTSVASGPVSTPSLTPPPAPGSPHSSYFSESSSSESESESRSSSSHQNSQSIISEGADKPPPLPPKQTELMYLRPSSIPSPLPSPAVSTFGDKVVSPRDTFGAPTNPRNTLRIDDLAIDERDTLQKPSIVINGIDRVDAITKSKSPTEMASPASSAVSPATPVRRYRGWVSHVVAPLEEFIDQVADPRELYYDLQEIAEAESGSVFAARVTKPKSLGLASDVSFVAIKNVPILPSGSHKIMDLRNELTLMGGVSHENVLTMDALYIDLVEDSLWIRMELMERSLADVVGLVTEGLMVQERMIARFASDVDAAFEPWHAKH